MADRHRHLLIEPVEAPPQHLPGFMVALPQTSAAPINIHHSVGSPLATMPREPPPTIITTCCCAARRSHPLSKAVQRRHPPIRTIVFTTVATSPELRPPDEECHHRRRPFTVSSERTARPRWWKGEATPAQGIVRGCPASDLRPRTTETGMAKLPQPTRRPKHHDRGARPAHGVSCREFRNVGSSARRWRWLRDRTIRPRRS